MGSVSTKLHPNGLQYVEIDTDFCFATIFMQGAQIDQFKPKGKQALLWVSSAEDYNAGNGIRGGVPICWPWFGASDIEGFPQHGFARTRTWKLDSVNMVNQVAKLSFSLPISDQDRQYWPHDTSVKVEFELSESLKINLINYNAADYPVTLTQALHSYFPTSNIHQTRVSGLSDAKYIEFGKGPYPQADDSTPFIKETDRVYTDLTSEQVIHTPQGNITVSRQNSHSAVLWNPWIDKSERLSRFNSDDYLTMLCLEAANVLEDAVVLQPGQTHTLTTEISWAE
ncbi:D-hexose-6-phosphate mutarotase [Shewanella maritima]|uniref:D-hexose-6-phosphate mutarotase n=1 Tax=Shewanella maritima TaxID=2520507 RepID=UPI0037352E65